MNLIGLVGFQGSGKGTASRILLDEFDYHGLSFADALKDVVAAVFCWPRYLLEGDTVESREWRERVDSWWAERLRIPEFTPRWALQNIGTNVLRRYFDQNIWIHNVERRLSLLPADANVVLIDGRFPNELELVRRLGGKVVRIQRGSEPAWHQTAVLATRGDEQCRDIMANVYKVHESEWAWIDCEIDVTILNNKSVADLHRRMKALAR